MSKQKGEYDVFISYSSKDLAWVKNELLEYLEKHGVTVCIDYRDFEPGKSSIQNMEHAILNSRKTLLILTADYIASAWTEFENILLQTLDPTNKESRIIPLMKNKEGAKLPLRLKALTYLNFYDPIDKDLEYQRLLKILSGVKKKDSFSFDDKWVGRQQCIKDLSYKITQKSCRLLILSGITGIGKSALGERIAMELSDWLRNDWSCYQRENFEDSGQSSKFTNIASKWLEKWGEIVTPEDRKDSHQLLDRLTKKLCEQRYLIQIDSLENILEGNEDNGWSDFKDPLWVDFFEMYLKMDTCQSCIILTSQDLPGQLQEISTNFQKSWHCQTLFGLEKEEQIELFETMGVVSDITSNSRTYLERIGNAYEGHPLAIRVISGEIKNHPFMGNILAYWNKYSVEIEEVERVIAEAEIGESSGVDKWQLDRFSRSLRRNVRSRLNKTFARLKSESWHSYILLCETSVYRCPVPEEFWLGHLEEWEINEDKQKIALDTLLDRYLVEEVVKHDQHLLRQHNLIRSVSLNHLRLIDDN